MIKHIVMWKLKERANGKSKAENALLMKERLEGLVDQLDELHSAEVGISFLEESGGAFSDVVLTATMDTYEDLEVYRKHKIHLKVVDFIVSVAEERRVVDYEM
ncbi:MAG: Dabb family protein [Bacteroidota bacterium]